MTVRRRKPVSELDGKTTAAAEKNRQTSRAASRKAPRGVASKSGGKAKASSSSSGGAKAPDAAAMATVPFLSLKGVVVFPFSLSPVVVDGKEDMTVVQSVAEGGERILALFPEMPPHASEEIAGIGEFKLEIPQFKRRGVDICRVGVLGRVVKMLRHPDGSLRVLLRGIKRVVRVDDGADQTMATVRDAVAGSDKSLETMAMARNAIDHFKGMVSSSPHFPEELKVALLNIDDQERMADMIADTININYFEKVAILTLPTLNERLRLLTILLGRDLELMQVGSKIQSQVQEALGKSQREVFLREQLKAIKHELGEETNSDVGVFEERLKGLSLPEEVEKVARKEMERLGIVHPASGEYHIVHNYIDWLLSLPWNRFTEDTLDVPAAAKILDHDHYDLKEVKDRILEFLAVLQLKKDRKSPILCFVGPPGVGKTSLGRSIAAAMGRRFVRMSLGGVRDEAEIRGHRRTYIGALPGRIIQGVRKADAANPVFMLDEIDKLASDFRGDPASALLEALDPEQNSSFSDHYLEVDFDLSSVMFIATANLLDPIPPALLDRMEIIRIPGYTSAEKRQIAVRHLIPRQLKANGLKRRQITFSSAGIDQVIGVYTREAGVRNLERTLGTVCRKVARKIVEGSIPPSERTVVTPDNLVDFLGAEKFPLEEAELNPRPGMATGLAWTSVGGVVLSVEAVRMAGKGELKMTGSLGEVMRESGQAAFSFIKSGHQTLGVKPEVFSKFDYHVHVPEGATPKDGPSAGITIAIALISLITGESPRPRVAMTGEVTLSGRVLGVGGVKEKSIAALRAGMKTMILPAANRKDLEEIPEEVKRKLEFAFVDSIEQAKKLLFNR